jgi:hypothetical protein
MTFWGEATARDAVAVGAAWTAGAAGAHAEAPGAGAFAPDDADDDGSPLADPPGAPSPVPAPGVSPKLEGRSSEAGRNAAGSM